MDKQYKACIFDLDGTIADTIETIAYFANQALIKFNLKTIQTNRYRYLVGNGAKNLVYSMLDEIKEPHSSFEKVYTEYNKLYEADFIYKTKIYDGVLEVLQNIKYSGIKCAVLSNKPDNVVRQVVNSLFGADFFDVCYGQREGVSKKPDPYMAMQIAKELDVSPKECLYFGDTDVDMLTGKNADMDTVGVLWGFRDYEELYNNGATYIVSEAKEIEDILKIN